MGNMVPVVNWRLNKKSPTRVSSLFFLTGEISHEPAEQKGPRGGQIFYEEINLYYMSKKKRSQYVLEEKITQRLNSITWSLLWVHLNFKIPHTYISTFYLEVK